MLVVNAISLPSSDCGRCSLRELSPPPRVEWEAPPPFSPRLLACNRHHAGRIALARSLPGGRLWFGIELRFFEVFNVPMTILVTTIHGCGASRLFRLGVTDRRTHRHGSVTYLNIKLLCPKGTQTCALAVYNLIVHSSAAA